MTGFTGTDQARWETNFWLAYDTLDKKNIRHLMIGISLAVELQKAIVRQGIHIIENNAITTTGEKCENIFNRYEYIQRPEKRKALKRAYVSA